MKLLFKQRLFSWFDSYDIYDEQGGTAYTVQGRMAWGHRLEIHDSAGRHVGTVKEVVFSFLPRFELHLGGRHVGNIKKELTFLKPRFTLDLNGWQVKGDLWEWNYQVTDPAGRLIMTAQKRLLNLTDTYVIDVVDPGNSLLALMIVLAIDAAKCSQSS